MKKINLKEFKQSEVKIAQLLEAKGGSGASSTSGGNTSSMGNDQDCRGGDCDTP